MNKNKLTYKLPDTMSELLTQALDDLEKVEKTDGYQIDMSAWHAPLGEERVCHVCLAGAALVGVGFPKHLDYTDTDCDEDTERKLDVLNLLRLGMTDSAARVMRLHRPLGKSLDRYITDYSKSPEEFKTELRQLVADLKEAGL